MEKPSFVTWATLILLLLNLAILPSARMHKKVIVLTFVSLSVSLSTADLEDSSSTFKSDIKFLFKSLMSYFLKVCVYI